MSTQFDFFFFFLFITTRDVESTKILLITTPNSRIFHTNFCTVILMAALYLHNALFNPVASEQSPPTVTSDPYTPHHGRYRSSQSSATVEPSFRTSSSEFSYPTEPLLDPEYTGSYAYADLLSRQPTHPSGPTPGWDMGLSLTGDKPTMGELKGFWEKAVKQRLRRLKIIKAALGMLLGM